MNCAILAPNWFLPVAMDEHVENCRSVRRVRKAPRNLALLQALPARNGTRVRVFSRRNRCRPHVFVSVPHALVAEHKLAMCLAFGERSCRTLVAIGAAVAGLGMTVIANEGGRKPRPWNRAGPGRCRSYRHSTGIGPASSVPK